MAKFIKNSDYSKFIKDIKERIQSSQIKAALSVNKELILLYWYMGQKIVEKQAKAVWGDGFLLEMSKDLMESFPDIKGLSLRNLKYIRQWYLFWQQPVSKSMQEPKTKQPVSFLEASQQNAIGQQLVAQLAQIPWGHNLVILSKSKNQKEALFYIQKTIENNWSRAVLTHQIELQLYGRSGKAITNFQNKLPKPQSDLALQITKDPYNFDFLQIREKHDELELENALISQMTKFLLELGAGFSFVGRQYKLVVDDEDFYADLLF